MGRLKTATTDDNIGEVHQFMLDNHRIKVREIAEAVNISKESVLYQILGIRKLATRCVPRLLTPDHYGSLLDKPKPKIEQKLGKK